jgi:Skp family chaperone for outer membrane proteins
MKKQLGIALLFVTCGVQFALMAKEILIKELERDVKKTESKAIHSVKKETGVKIAVFTPQEFGSQLNAVAQASAKIEQDVKKIDGKIKELTTELQKKEAEVKSARSTMSEDAKQKADKELEGLQKRLDGDFRALMQERQRIMYEEGNIAQEGLAKDLAGALEAVRVSEGLDILMPSSDFAAGPGFDVTNKVVAELNKRHAKRNKAKSAKPKNK